ncbi:MAG: lytic murein transglycosylase B [Proteobacteria bacterium]|nr:lytic murein transglycosylase B [Pseudomonadota bacterium]MDA0982550.1 lytic murein transglycosylase B [Pseudomonadota bacterium]
MKAIAFALLLACAASVPALAKDAFTQRADVRAFIRDMAERHAFVESELQFLFARTRRMESVLKAITPPKDPRARSWRAYRGRFVNEARIGEGLDFWRRHEAALSRAAEAHGVPEEIIVSIIGVETLYGRNAGSFRVIDALATLAFLYPPRATYFRSELEQYLLFTRDAGLDVFSVKGSYAGAIGIPQFMPGSYRRFAVDFDGDGIVDLRASPADAVGSVANFLKEHGWRRGEPVQLLAHVAGEAHRPMLEAGIEPKFTLASLGQHGVETSSSLPMETTVALIDLPTPEAPTEYRLGMRNFYVLTRYNRSSFYAAAVYDLAQELKLRR